MSDVGIFIAGAVVFIATAWATIAFGLSRFRELQRLDMEATPTPASVRAETSFTEVWVPTPGQADQADQPEPQA